MEANEKQLKQRKERLVIEKEEEDRLIQIMLNKFKVCYKLRCRAREMISYCTHIPAPCMHRACNSLL